MARTSLRRVAVARLVAVAMSAALLGLAGPAGAGLASAWESDAGGHWAPGEAIERGSGQQATVSAPTGRGAAAPARQVSEPDPPPSRCVATASKTAAPEILLLGGTVDVELGLVLTCPEEPAPLDVAMVLDRSGSMTGWPLRDAKEAAIGFVRLMDLSNRRVAVVSFASTGRLDARLSSNERRIESAIGALVADGGTNISAGLRVAGRALLDADAPQGVARAIVILTDGRDGLGRDAVRQQAELLRPRGVHIITIGLGLQADVTLLRQIATTSEDFHYAPRSQDLAVAYGRIAARLRRIEVVGIVVRDELPPDMELVPGSAEPAAEVDGRSVMWRLPHMPAGGLRVRLRLRPAQYGRQPTNSWARAAFTDTAGRPGTVQFPVPFVSVLHAVPSATPARVPPPTLTPPWVSPSASPPATRRTPTPTHGFPGRTPPTATTPERTPIHAERPWVAFLPSLSKYACAPERTPIDIVLVLDASTTMLRPTGSGMRKLDAAAQASAMFVGLVDPARVRVGLVAFNSRARVLVGLTRDRRAVADALGEIAVREGSRIDLGLQAASRLLARGPRVPEARSAVVLLTDGHPVGAGPDAVRAAAGALRARGTVVYAVAVGLDADVALLRQVAGEGQRLLDAGDGDAAARAYQDILGTLDCP